MLLWVSLINYIFIRCQRRMRLFINFSTENNLIELKTNVKFFSDHTSLCTIIKDINKSANALNNDLSLISKWVFNWKMFFYPDLSKPDQELLFSTKKKLKIHPIISVNNIHVEKVSSKTPWYFAWWKAEFQGTCWQFYSES